MIWPLFLIQFDYTLTSKLVMDSSFLSLIQFVYCNLPSTVETLSMNWLPIILTDTQSNHCKMEKFSIDSYPQVNSSEY